VIKGVKASYTWGGGEPFRTRKGVGGVGDPNHATPQKLWYFLYNTHCTIRTILPVLVSNYCVSVLPRGVQRDVVYIG
jgi:hypothetical protein